MSVSSQPFSQVTQWWSDEFKRWTSTVEASSPDTANGATWATEHELVAINDSVALRRFGGREAEEGRLPALIVTPQVNQSYIADFNERQSLVRTLLAQGVPEVGVTDWLPPPRGRDYFIADSIDDIGACVERLGGRVHLIGLCQGGWQSAILAATSPEAVASLTVAAAPIDAHAGSTVLHAWVFGLPMAFFEGVVAVGGGVAPGKKLAEGFDLMKPFERLVYNAASLYLNIEDKGFVQRYREIQRWYRMNKDIAGGLYLEAVRELFKANKLAKGEYELRGAPVALSNIRCPIHLVGGTRDHITPVEQVMALEQLAPEAPCKTYTVDAGHIGSFMGGTALRTAWTQIGQDLAAPA